MHAAMSSYVDHVNQAVAFLKTRIPEPPDIVIQLGTGLGGLVDNSGCQEHISYTEIPFFPESTVPSHDGKLAVARIGGRRVFLLAGRFHYYEGYSTKEISFPIRVMQCMGVKKLIVTNAAGGLNPLFAPGTIMVVRDHLNFLGENPLRGPNIDEWGPRFPDLSEPYNPVLAKTALESADGQAIKHVVTGVYACIQGPSLETPAETRWLRQSGADAVGMSSVPEVIVAIHGGMQVLGLSVVSNINDPDNFQPIILEEIIQSAAEAAPRLEQLLIGILKRSN